MRDPYGDACSCHLHLVQGNKCKSTHEAGRNTREGRQVSPYLLIPWEERERGVKPLTTSPCPSAGRVDANAHKKHLILKSCQGADLIEVLHYHACDSGSSPKSEYINCLLNLQVQHVSARFAVYLTGEDGLQTLPCAGALTPHEHRLKLAWEVVEEGQKTHPILLPFLLESLI